MAQVVAVVGASGNRRKFGNKAVRAFLNRGYKVIPINPRGVAIEGLETFTSILDVPGTIDLATVYVQPWIGPAIMDELADKGVVVVELRDKHGGGKDGYGGNDAAKVEANTGTGGAHAGDEQLGQEQRQPAEINAAEEA